MQQEVSEFQLAEVRNNDAVALAQSPALAEWSDFNGDAMLVDVALRCGMPLPTEIDTALHSAVVRVVREWQNGNSDIYQYSNDELKAIDQMRALKRARAALLHMDPRRRHFVCHVGSEAAQFRHALVHVDYFDLAVPCDDDAHRRLAEQSAVTMRAFEQCVAPHALTFVERYIRSLVIESIDLTSANVPLDHLAPLSHAMRATIVLSPNSRIGPGQAATLVHDDALSHATMPSELFDIPLPFVDHCADNNDTIDDNHDGVASAEDRLLYVHERTRVALLAHLDEALALLMDVKSVMKWNAIVASLGAADRQSAIYLLHQHRVNIENGQFESNHTIESSLVACDADGVERRVHLFRPKFCAVLPPRTVTVFFGGTSSHAAHCVHSSQWPRGELLASLAALHPGANGAGNYLYVDGISGTGVGLDHDWRFAPHGQTPVSVASGEGLIESAQHALCWLKGFSLYDKDTDALSAVYGSRAPIERVNVVGWSRGGVAAILLSHLIADDAWLGRIEVNVLAVDPVPGGNDFSIESLVHRIDRRAVTLPPQLHQFVGIYALSDRSDMFAPTVPVPARNSETLYELDGIVGAHSTLVGARSRHSAPIACAVTERVLEFLANNGASDVAQRVQRPSREQLRRVFEWLHANGDALHGELTQEAIIPRTDFGVGGVTRERQWLTFNHEADVTQIHHDGFDARVLCGVDRSRFATRHHQSL